ncbi:MAG TPA: PP2C family protein-serine/threonine phosphatase [Candidatus Limnocylindrales bacterium]|jgi:sigma-B regulation protein RsbU (phosphoserine phosphatase)|nr:PP2C family protein-serine/threonine phosphatase [Candidatus Limnocylindrales bacterium]
MAGVNPAPRFDVERIRRILEPFAAEAPALTVVLEDAGGRVIAASTDESPAPSPSLTRELRTDGALLGRLVASGPLVVGPVVGATIEALAVSLEHLADAGPRPVVADSSSSLAADLALGRLQQRTIVSLLAPDVDGYDLASHYEPAREVGGDFFELFRLRRRGHPLGVVIADVAGKGIAAALLMAFARPVIHAALDAASGPADALERTNRILVDELRTALFITALVGRLDVRTGQLRIANAGHESPLLVPGDGGPIRPVEGCGPLLGAFSALDLVEIDIDLRPGDQLVLYTDGVTDSRAPSGERFGKPRLIEALEQARGLTAQDLVDAVRDSVSSFRRAMDPVDDVTIVAIGRHSES